jgi:hypothetical protein
VGVPVATCVELDNAAIKPTLLLFGEWAFNRHSLRFTSLLSSYAPYQTFIGEKFALCC